MKEDEEDLFKEEEFDEDISPKKKRDLKRREKDELSL